VIAVIGTGQVAQHVINYLRTQLIPHVVFTRSSSPLEEGAYFYAADDLPRLFDTHKVEAVINCAALRDIALCEKDPALAYEANVHLPKKISELAHQVYISTDYVFDNNHEARVLDEAARSRGALSVYGQSKLEGEDTVLRRAGVVARISSPFGIYPSPMKPHFVDFAAMKVGDLTLPNDQHFRMSYLPDVTPLLVQLTNKLASDGVYHLTNEGGTNWVEVARFARQLNRNKSKTFGVVRHDTTRPEYGILVNTRLPKLRHWTEAMQEYFQRGDLAEGRIRR